MVLLTWRLMPAEVDPRWNPETWEPQFYFTSCTLSRNQSSSFLSPEVADRGETFPAAPSPHLFHQLHFV